MEIKQFEDKNLSHFSYAILSSSEKKIILVDPSRNTQDYLYFAKENDAKITGIIETHAHADFISSHLELHEITGATIYASKLLNAKYPHHSFDDGQQILIGKIRLTAINTPGHSPDSICVLLEHNEKKLAVFTGDTLFVGDCGRPDLRQEKGNRQTTKQVLAKQLYHSLHEQLMLLPDELVVYPAHGAGTLCGKSLSDAKSSTIAIEKQANWSLQSMPEEIFVDKLLCYQPFVPRYFPFDVMLNINGAAALQDSLERIKINIIKNKADTEHLKKDTWIIDTRDENIYKQAHLPQSINIMGATKFETWLGSVIHPEEAFYLAAESESQLTKLLQRAAAIGYESQIIEGLVIDYSNVISDSLDLDFFKSHQNTFTIIDVRNLSEVGDTKIFSGSLTIPLPELRDSLAKIPTDKPLIVHCASGFRSAVGSSLLQSIFKDQLKVYDMGKAVKEFIK